MHRTFNSFDWIPKPHPLYKVIFKSFKLKVLGKTKLSPLAFIALAFTALLTVKFDKHVVILFNIVNPDIYNDVFIDVPPVLCFLKLK